MADHGGGSVVALGIFLTIFSFQFLSKWLDVLTTKKGSKSSDEETQLREEIKQLLNEANALSQPSTFAQAAKLRRLAAAKERELASYQESHKKEKRVSHDLYPRVLLISKVLTYFVLICWFWEVPVATISQQLVQPFGKMLSWKGGGISNSNVMVGVIPWLILSTRVSKFVCRFFKF